MKKILLMAAAFVAVSTASFAQVQRAELRTRHDLKFDKKMVNTLDKSVLKHQPTAAPFQVKSRRAYDDGVWYARPTGTYYYEASNSENVFLIVPPFTDLKFTNMMPDETYKEASWLFNGQDMAEYNVTDENNNLVYSFQKSASYPPTISSKGIEFKLVDYIVPTDSFPIAMEPFNYSKSRRYMGGEDEQGNMWSYFQVPEVMDFDFEGDGSKENVTLSALGQVYQKPATALYLYEISTYITAPGNPLANGKKLTAKICRLQKDAEGNPIRNASGRYLAGDVIAELESDESKVYMYNNQTFGNDKYYAGIMWFSKSTNDDFGNEEEQPVIIDDDFMVIIEGLDQEGLKLNFHFCDLGEDMVELASGGQPAYMYYVDTTTKQPMSRTLSYYGQSENKTNYCYSLGLTLSGEMDAVRVFDASAEQKVAAEGGQTAADFVYQEQTVKMPVYVYSVFPIVERSGEDLYLTDNYSFVNLPEWVELASVDDTYFEYPGEAGDGSDAVRGETHLYFSAQPLPAGQTGRAVRVWIESKRGTIASQPIYFLQGDATVADGIAAIKFDAQGKMVGTYNLGGARVSANAKGLLIKDGKKMLNK